jgi:hypothetical protein
MQISRSIEISASPADVYALVSDLPRMGELSPENAGGRWLGDPQGPEVGARFRGRNRNGWRRWSTTATVTAADPGREFTFDVAELVVPISRWSYSFAPTATGCTVTESWTDRRPGWFKKPAGLATGVMDRETATAAGIEATLGALKARAEAATRSAG